MSAHPEPSLKDRKIILSNNTVDNKLICCVDKKPINKKSEIELHHLRPLAFDNSFNESNFITVCKKHHKEMGDLSFSEYLAVKEMEKFFSGGSIKKLNDVLKLKLKEGNSVRHFKT